MNQSKKYIAILVILCLVLAACVVVLKTAGSRESKGTAVTDDPAAAAETLPEPGQEPPAETPAPMPEATPEPTAEPTPEPTEEPIAEPTPEPTPEATPVPAPVVTKNPTNETGAPGTTVYFIARADGADTISWFLASPDGKEGINAADIKSKFAESTCTGTDGEMLGIGNVVPEMDGWKVVAKFTGPGGEAFSEPAYIYVTGISDSIRTLDEVLVSILNGREFGTAGVGLSYAKLTGMIADFFADGTMSADEVKNAVQQYTQRLSGDHRTAYKEKAEAVLSDFREAADESFVGRLNDSGYTAKHYPWDDARVKACMEALLID